MERRYGSVNGPDMNQNEVVSARENPQEIEAGEQPQDSPTKAQQKHVEGSDTDKLPAIAGATTLDISAPVPPIDSPDQIMGDKEGGDVKLLPENPGSPDSNANPRAVADPTNIELEEKTPKPDDSWVTLTLATLCPFLEADPKNLESFNEFVNSQLLINKSQNKIDDVVPI